MQVSWIALFSFVFQVPVSHGGVFPVPANLRDGADNPLMAIPKEQQKRGPKKKNQRSTSSSSGERIGGSASGDSLGFEDSGDSYADATTRVPGEPQGWRKWHRRCAPCPRDMAKVWRDPTIKWICGAYQRARRSFKSTCMMQYRNCQDGTMFVKMADQRCDDQAPGYSGGRHFLYDYPVQLPDDSSSKQTDESADDTYDETYSSE